AWAGAVRQAVASHARDLSVLGPPGWLAIPPDPGSSDGPGRLEDGVSPEATALARRLQAIADHAQRLFEEMDFRFLFDPVRKLFSIGYRTRDGTLDPSYYDLLASEARLTSFLAIAKGDVPADHWFRLGRSLTPVGRGSALVSWSGSMFEYLMPSLVMREALDYTARRLPEGAKVAVVKSYMAHHQGMLLVAIGNVLNDRVMLVRFHADRIVEATELLLHERMPRDVLVARPRAEEAKSAADVRDLVPPVLRRFTSPNDAIPRTHLLSNGRYAVMTTAAGSGYSRWG